MVVLYRSIKQIFLYYPIEKEMEEGGLIVNVHGFSYSREIANCKILGTLLSLVKGSDIGFFSKQR